jgi:DNA-binding response OmpR family regulator
LRDHQDPQQSKGKTMASATTCPSPRVLIVEDDQELGATLVQALSLTGKRVVGCARDSHTAAGMLALAFGPTVALVDYNLLDGPCDQLLDTLALAGIPVALLTGYRPNELPDACLRFPILTKPYGIAALSNMVDELAGQLAG